MTRRVFEGNDIVTCNCDEQVHDAIRIGDDVHLACRNCHRTVGISAYRTPAEEDDASLLAVALLILAVVFIIALVAVAFFLVNLYAH